MWPKITRPKNRAIWHDLAQIDRIAARMPEPYAFVPRVQLTGGFRTGEVLALRPSWIDWENRIVRPQHASFKRQPSPGKKGALPRELPLTHELEAALRMIPDEVWSEEHDLCFTEPDGKMLPGNQYGAYWSAAVAASGELPVAGSRLDAYSLRTTHINWHMEAGTIAVSDLAEYLGTSIQEIERSYNRQTHERRRRNAERLDMVFAAFHDAAEQKRLANLAFAVAVEQAQFCEEFAAQCQTGLSSVGQALIAELKADRALRDRIRARVKSQRE